MSNIENVRLNVRVTGELATYVKEQTSPNGLYEGQSDLVRDALRQHRANKIQEIDNPSISDLQQRVINSYKEMAAGNFSDKTHEELFNQAVKNIEAKGIKISE